MISKVLKMVLVGAVLVPISVGIGKDVSKVDAHENWMNKRLNNPSVSKGDLLKLKKGTYNYKGIYLGMKNKEVMSKIGYGKEYNWRNDYNIKDDGMKGTFYYGMYGKNNNVSLNFYDRRPNISYKDTRLTQIDFNMSYGKGYTKKNIEKYLGKADKSDGNIKRDKFIYRTYGYLDVAYVKDVKRKDWKVIGFTYHSPINKMGIAEYKKTK